MTKIKLVSSKTVNEPEKRPHRDPELIECVNRVFLDRVHSLCVFKSVLILYLELQKSLASGSLEDFDQLSKVATTYVCIAYENCPINRNVHR